MRKADTSLSDLVTIVRAYPFVPAYVGTLSRDCSDLCTHVYLIPAPKSDAIGSVPSNTSLSSPAEWLPDGSRNIEVKLRLPTPLPGPACFFFRRPPPPHVSLTTTNRNRQTIRVSGRRPQPRRRSSPLAAAAAAVAAAVTATAPAVTPTGGAWTTGGAGAEACQTRCAG